MPDKSKILVVEDNDFVRMQIVSYLRSAGFEPVEASDGAGALARISQETDVDLVIADIRMEPVGGIEFVREMRSRNIVTPVVFVTGDQTADVLEQAGKLGVRAVLMKPVMKDRLIKTVQKTIEAARRSR